MSKTWKMITTADIYSTQMHNILLLHMKYTESHTVVVGERKNSQQENKKKSEAASKGTLSPRSIPFIVPQP